MRCEGGPIFIFASSREFYGKIKITVNEERVRNG